MRILSDADNGCLVNFNSDEEGRKACATWLVEREMMEVVKVVADVFFDGKLNERPRCYEHPAGAKQKTPTV